MTFVMIGLGGALGAMARYILSQLVDKMGGTGLSWGMLAVNVLGSFLMGFVIGFALQESWEECWNLFLLTGFSGAFTTFSTYSVEVAMLIQEGEVKLGLITMVAHNAISLLCAGVGLWLWTILFAKSSSF